jgi:hypothetical protein
MAAPGIIGFTVVTEELTEGWRVTISLDAGQPVAEVIAPDVHTGLLMAVPCMAVLSDPLEAMWRGTPAQDGPPDAG